MCISLCQSSLPDTPPPAGKFPYTYRWKNKERKGITSVVHEKYAPLSKLYYGQSGFFLGNLNADVELVDTNLSTNLNESIVRGFRIFQPPDILKDMVREYVEDAKKSVEQELPSFNTKWRQSKKSPPPLYVLYLLRKLQSDQKLSIRARE
jgi:hypothetical protein